MTRALFNRRRSGAVAVALAVYFHETHVKYTYYAAQARTCRGRTTPMRTPGHPGP